MQRVKKASLSLCAVVMAWGVATASAVPMEMNTVDTLRQAIDHLSTTYGEAYPSGADYLARLDTISDASSPEYKQLQREALLNHPYVKGYEWLVEVRNQYWGNHGPINTMFQNGDINHGASGGLKAWSSTGGRLERIAIQDDGSVVRTRVLAEAPEGILRDADVSFDGTKILFSMRRNKADDYHLYEMGADGSQLTQLTFGSMISDTDAIYMPDGRIVFSSTRDPKFCQCNRHISNNIFAMESDGANIEQISFNDLADFHSSLMPDGRVIYSRWEYVDRYFGPSLGLWTINPDGTRLALFMGNNSWTPGAMLDPRAIPGTDKVVCIYGSTHDLPWGALAVVDRSKGLDGNEPVVHMWPESGREFLNSDPKYNTDMNNRWHVDLFKKLNVRYEDPYPVHEVEKGLGGGHFFMVSKTLSGPLDSYKNRQGEPVKMALVLVDVFGNEVTVYETGETGRNPFGAIPVAARKKPALIPQMMDHSREQGLFYVNDVYLGTGHEMTGVKKGDIKYLRIVEAPPKRTYDDLGGWGIDASQTAPMNWNLTNNKRILGDVPVEEDGSAFFQVPADTFIYFMALDKDKQMVQAMRSATVLRPGETQGCIGCHENRLQAPMPANPMPKAMRRAPSQLEPWFDTPSVAEAQPFNYLTDVQPVFDAHCVKCHDYGKKAGDTLNLSGDLSLPFNISYTELMRQSGIRYTGPEEKLINLVQDGPPAVLPAYAWGSHRSRLVRLLKEGHYGVKLTEEEMQRITSWIDVNGVYYGSYESRYAGRNPVISLPNGWNVNKQVFGGRAQRGPLVDYLIENGPLVNFTRPERSACLADFDEPAEREIALSHLKDAAALLAQAPREDQPNAGPSNAKVDQHNRARYDRLRAENEKSKQAIIDRTKQYQFKK